jgi:hypothetical protein
MIYYYFQFKRAINPQVIAAPDVSCTFIKTSYVKEYWTLISRNQEFSVYFLAQDHSRGLLLTLYQNTCLLRNSYVNWQEQHLCYLMSQHLWGLKSKPYQSRSSPHHFFPVSRSITPLLLSAAVELGAITKDLILTVME